MGSRLPRSSSVDSMVEAVWAESVVVEQDPPSQKRPSIRPDRPVALVSPSVGRRVKGQRGINGEFFSFLSNEAEAALTDFRMKNC